MSFPVYVEFAGIRCHPHLFFEALAYGIGTRVYFARRREAAHPAPRSAALWILVGCVFGAWAGSKLLAWAESPAQLIAAVRADGWALLGGKTIVGGLLGGWAGVEVAKRRCGITQSTGDGFVWPLVLGMAMGRLGCFLTGLEDRTYGVATTLPWGVDFGDGVRRHPTQLYESLFVLLLGGAVHWGARDRAFPSGVGFRLFLFGYLGFRFCIEFAKPREMPLGVLSAIQMASLLGCIACWRSLQRLTVARP